MPGGTRLGFDTKRCKVSAEPPGLSAPFCPAAGGVSEYKLGCPDDTMFIRIKCVAITPPEGRGPARRGMDAWQRMVSCLQRAPCITAMIRGVSTGARSGALIFGCVSLWRMSCWRFTANYNIRSINFKLLCGRATWVKIM